MANSSVENVVIPNTVTSIGKSAFSGCSKLSSICYYGNEEQWNNIITSDTSNELINATKYYIVPSITEMKVIQTTSGKLLISLEAKYLPEDADIYIVSYDDNRMLEMKSINISNMETELSSFNVDAVKCFAWSKNLQPLCDSKVVISDIFIVE